MESFNKAQKALKEAQQIASSKQAAVSATQTKMDELLSTVESTSQLLQKCEVEAHDTASVVSDAEKKLEAARTALEVITEQEKQMYEKSMKKIQEIIEEDRKNFVEKGLSRKSFWRPTQFKPNIPMRTPLNFQSFVDRTMKLAVILHDGDQACYVPETKTSHALKCRTVNGNDAVVFLQFDPEWHGDW